MNEPRIERWNERYRRDEFASDEKNKLPLTNSSLHKALPVDDYTSSVREDFLSN